MMDLELMAIDIERTFSVRFIPDLTGIGLDSVTFPSGMTSASGFGSTTTGSSGSRIPAAKSVAFFLSCSFASAAAFSARY